MVLNYIWVAFFIIAFGVALLKLLIGGNVEVFPAMLDAIFEMSKTAFEIALGLTGILTLWLGLMKIGEKSGLINILARVIGPFFSRLFPEIPRNHPVLGHILMNFSSNMLGLDNAATPIGLKAMQGMQELNPHKDTASNAQIMFLVLNTSGLTIIPISIMVYRSQMGAVNPADVFIPILITTFFSTLAGLLAVALYQRINLIDKVILLYLSGISLFIGFVIYYFSNMPQEQMQVISKVTSSFFLLLVIVLFIGMALIKKINVFDTFIEGAKEGFEMAIKIIPYLVAILVGVAVFRASGTMDYLLGGLKYIVQALGLDDRFVEAMPTAFMKPLSGGGARSMMVDTMKTYGADSFAGRLSSIFQGSVDTTFYIIALYFGSVGVKKTRYAVTCGLIADLASVIAAIWVAYMFFG